MPVRARIWLYAALAGAIAAGGAIAVVVSTRASASTPATPAVLDDYGAVPAFTFRDQTDTDTTDAWLRGHVTIIDFIFTRCDTVCPALSGRMSNLDTQLADLPDVRLLSFSVDPGHDTPAVLAAYAPKWGAKPERWKFLTTPPGGDAATMRALIEGPLMTAMVDSGVSPSGAPDIRHGGHFLLVDRDLRIRGVYDSNDAARLTALARDARRLAQ